MKLLVIISRDYGELGGAMYFLNGIALDAPVMLMLPQGMREPDLPGGSFALRRYDALNDIVQAVEQYSPDTVMLFSGYLLTIGRRFSLFNALRLFRFLRRKGISLLTSDPFIGLIRSPRSLAFSTVLDCHLHTRPALHRLAVWLMAHVLALRIYLMHKQLRRVWHIYPSPMDAAQFLPGHRWLSYFNGHQGDAVSMAPEEDPAPAWIFVLSRVDCEIQTQRHGQSFIVQLAGRLHDCVQAGRRAVLIGTPELVEVLRPKVLGEARIELRVEDSYASYMHSLMRAEYAFFWNYYSFSIIQRVIATRPVFFFDAGHMVTILPALAEAGIQTFYAGWRPPLLPMAASITTASLAAAALETRHQFQRISGRLAQGLSPQDLLQEARRQP